MEAFSLRINQSDNLYNGENDCDEDGVDDDDDDHHHDEDENLL